LVVGIVLTLIGLIGMAATVGNPAAGPWVRYLFIPSYAAGALCLVIGGIVWLWTWSRQGRR
jgi:hypothetical protein